MSRPLTLQQKARILRLYDPRHTHGSGHIAGIARTVGTNPTTVKRVIKEAGVK